MSWNYRIIKTEFEGGFDLTIREVYYDENSKLVGYSQEPDYVYATNEDENQLESLRWQLDRMKESLEKPILTLDDFK